MSTAAPARAGGCVTGDGSQKARTAGPSLKLDFLTSTPALVATLVLVSFACFYPSLSSYFLADDFVHLAYVFDACKGNSDVLLRNFVSTWMQAQGIQFYRPLYTLTLALDYLLGGANPLVFHLSNLLFHAGATVFLFLLSRRLLREYGRLQSTIVAWLAGATFAVFPLSAEVVSWISARGDSLCAMFYLAAFWLFVRSIQERCRWSLASSLAACAAGLLSKEMAVTLAATLTLYSLIAAPSGTPWPQRLRWALARTWLFWMVTGGYLVLRTMALGTITGGYSGSIGEGLSGSIFRRWMLEGSFFRVLLPFNAEVFSTRNWLRMALNALYLLAAAGLFAGLLTRSITRYALFAAAWFVVAMSPTYQVWNLTTNLQGSRFIYLGTAPLVLLVVLLVYPLAGELTRMRRLARLYAVCVLGSLLVCFASIGYRNNLVWVEAGAQVRSLKQEIESVFSRLKPGQELVVLNLPQEHHGAHMLYNGAMLSGLTSPPLARENLTSRVATFEPALFGDSDLIISSRLRRYAEQGDKYVFTTFDQAMGRLVPVNLKYSSEADVAFDMSGKPDALTDGRPRRVRVVPGPGGFVVKDPGQPTCVVSPAMNLPSLATDFVDVDLTCEVAQAGAAASAPAPAMLLKWTSDRYPALPAAPGLARELVPDGSPHRYRFPVSQHKTWVSSGRVLHVALVFLPGRYTATIKGLRLSRGLAEIPLLEPAPGLEEDPTGICRMSRNVAACNYDVSRLRAAVSTCIELSRPNAFFEHYSGKFRDTGLSPHAYRRFQIPSLKGRFELPASAFPGAGYYQLRAAGIGADGKVVEYVSDPLNLQVAAAQVTASRNAKQEAGSKHGR